MTKGTVLPKEKREIRNDVFRALSNAVTPDDLKSKSGINYIPWAVAWDRVTRLFPTAEYKIFEDENGHQYFYDEMLDNFEVRTEITIEGITHNMWATVTANNVPVRKEAYTVTSKKGSYTIPGCTLNDINRAKMRCLTKNLAMFGLGLWVYAQEEYVQYEEEYEPKSSDMSAMFAPSAKPVTSEIKPKRERSIDSEKAIVPVMSITGLTIEKALASSIERPAKIKTFKEVWEAENRDYILATMTSEGMQDRYPKDYEIAMFLKETLSEDIAR